MTDDLDILDPAPAAVTYRGERLEIRPLQVGQLPALVRSARPVLDAITAADTLPEAGDPALVPLLLDLVENHGERVFEAAALCIDRPVDWVAKGQLDEFVTLASTVIEVNRDFFVRRLGPLLAGRAAGASAPVSGAGPTASSS